MKPYVNQFAPGDRVRVQGIRQLEDFQCSWKYHHPLESIQLDYAGRHFEVEQVGFYHGGDVIYQLKGVPGIWHEVCLCPADLSA